MAYAKNVLDSQRDLQFLDKTPKYIIVKAKFGPSRPTKIPLNLTNEVAFLAGVIIGDGHLRKSKFQIVVELTKYSLLQKIKRICLTSFERNFNISRERIRPNKKNTRQIIIDGKAIHNLMNIVFQIPRGKKSYSVKVPSCIKTSTKSIKRAFLQGILVTEGGKRRRGYGLSTASKKLRRGIGFLLTELNIQFKQDSGIHKKYGREYYGIVFNQYDLPKIFGERA